MSRPDITQSERALYFDDPPAITVLKERTVVARIAHKCHCCGQEIKPGDSYRYFFIKDYESIPPRAFASHQHFYCPRDL